MERETSRRWEVTSAGLHLLAMACMLLDHAWATLPINQLWMTCVGRIAFPIFAFTTVEGYFHTGNFKKYMGRMLLFALLSEIPFNLMCGGSVIYPFHQNVLWTFLIALGTIHLMEKLPQKPWRWPVTALIALLGILLGYVFFTDYNGAGVAMVYVFYFFRQKKWWCYLGQLLGMYWINVELLGGMYHVVNLFGMELEVVQQGFALLALIPIWLYRGSRGYHSKWFQIFCYAFYPVHMALLVLVGLAL